MIVRLKWLADLDALDKPIKYYAVNDKGEVVGRLVYERTGRFMHWCWYQTTDFKMSPGCVEEMRLKQKELGGKKS